MLANFLPIRIGNIVIPTGSLLAFALLAFLMWAFLHTKIGTAMTAVGSNPVFARAAGIDVDRTRIISVVMSTVCAGFGMVIYLQNIGNAFLGVILFHLMFIVAPGAGAFITGDSMVGEYFQVFLSYGVIVNLPAVLAGLPEDAWLSEFVPAATEQPEDEEVPGGDEFGLEDDLGLNDGLGDF